MSAAPSIAMILMLAFLSMFGATILSKPWMRWTALGCAVVEVAMAIFLICIVSR